MQMHIYTKVSTINTMLFENKKLKMEKVNRWLFDNELLQKAFVEFCRMTIMYIQWKKEQISTKS